MNNISVLLFFSLSSIHSYKSSPSPRFFSFLLSFSRSFFFLSRLLPSSFFPLLPVPLLQLLPCFPSLSFPPFTHTLPKTKQTDQTICSILILTSVFLWLCGGLHTFRNRSQLISIPHSSFIPFVHFTPYPHPKDPKIHVFPHTTPHAFVYTTTPKNACTQKTRRSIRILWSYPFSIFQGKQENTTGNNGSLTIQHT